VFLGSAVILTIVALDVAILGPRSTGLNLETASDEVAGTAPRPGDAGPRFMREEPRTVTRAARTEAAEDPAERRVR
jgi:hypothetical protein